MIGENVLRFIIEERTDVESSSSNSSSMLEYMYYGSYNHKLRNKDRCSPSPRILIHGPSHSGKTSLIMDVAHSLAKRCKNGITMIKHCSSSTQFPYRCIPRKDIEQGSYGSNVTKESLDTNSLNHCIQEEGKNYQWNPQSLQNINVKYISSWSELISFLSTASETTRTDDGFILDDLHRFLSHGYSNTDETLMKLRLVMALVLDIVKEKGTMILSLDTPPFVANEKDNRYFLNFHPYVNTIFQIIPPKGKNNNNLDRDKNYALIMQQLNNPGNSIKPIIKIQDCPIASGSFQINKLKLTTRHHVSFNSDENIDTNKQQDNIITWDFDIDKV